MKKFIYTFLIALSLLGITSCCFASANWGVYDLEKFLSCYGYDFDFANANYTNNYKYSNLQSNISKSDYPLIVFDMRNGGSFYPSNNSVPCDFVFFNAYNAVSSSSKLILTKNASGDYFYYFGYGSYGYAVDIDNNTVYCSFNAYYTNDYWNERNLKVSHEEFVSTAFQEYLIKRYGLIYTETTIYANDGKTPLIVPQGGEIKQSSFNDVAYKGKITYGATTETTNITYTSGFTADTNYDLFLEVYKLGDSYDNGITAYPVDTIDLGTVSTSVTSKKIDIKKASSSSFYVYKLCVGKNNFDTSGTNDVYLSTKWLLFNDNIVRRYKDFSRCHTMRFLSLIAYDYGYNYDDEDTSDVPGSDTEYFFNYPYVISSPGGRWSGDNLSFKIGYKFEEFGVDIDTCYLYFEKYGINGSGELFLIDTLTIRPFDTKYYNFDEFYYEFDVLDFDNSSAPFFKCDEGVSYCYIPYLRSNYGSGLYPEYSYKCIYFYTNEFAFNMATFDDIITKDDKDGFVSKLLNVFKGCFIPSSEFMTSYWNELYLFFKVKLGFLWDLVMFFPELINNIISVLKAELLLTSFTTPELSIPTFMGDGSEVVILESITFSPYEYWGQSKVFADLYTLYLNLMDFLVFFALFNYGLVVVAKILGFWVPEASSDSSKKSTKKE